MRTIIPILIFGLFLILVSCKKEKLEGDKAILIGKWEWVYTVAERELCDPDYSYTEILTPSTESVNYSMQFYEKGKISLFEDSEITGGYRLVFSSFDTSIGAVPVENPFKYYFNAYLDNEPSHFLQGKVGQDSLVVIRNYPFPDPSDACENYSSYFVRKQ